MIGDFYKHTPKISKKAFLADNATIIGDVVIKDGASIWFGAVLRGDYGRIVVGENSSVQDNAVVHGDPDIATIIGRNVTVGHSAIVHGGTVKDNVIVGMNSTILNKAVIGENTIIGANALITQNKVIPSKSMVIGVPAKVVRKLTIEEIDSIKKSAEEYKELAKKYASSDAFQRR